MATTTMTIAANRRRDIAVLSATVTGVALDAATNEFFRLPPGFGDLILEACHVETFSLSGAYVAPAPPFDGNSLYVIDQNVTTVVDFIGAGRYINEATSSARPFLLTWLDLQNPVLVRQTEFINVFAPVIAGAGVTASVLIRARGHRLRQA